MRNWIDAGTLPATHVGRRVRLKRSDFERLIEQGYSGGAAHAQTPATGEANIWDGEIPPPTPREPWGQSRVKRA